MKRCYKCETYKPLNGFCKNKRHKDGLNELCKDCKKTYNNSTKDQSKLYGKMYYDKNKHTSSQRNKSWRENNPTYQKEWGYTNQEKRKGYASKYKQKYPHIIRWRQILQDVLLRSNQIKTDSTHSLLGYSYDEFKLYLDNLGMVWGSHQIDHKIPITWFKLETPPHIVNDLRNLQPLDPAINRRKLNRYMTPTCPEYLTQAMPWILDEYIERIIN